MTVGEATQVAKEMGAPMSFLTHMTYMVDHDATEAELPENIHSGLRWSAP